MQKYSIKFNLQELPYYFLRSCKKHNKLCPLTPRYSQNLLSTVTERDVVNLFVGFLSGPKTTVYELGED